MPKQNERVRMKAFKVQKSTKVTSINALRQKEEERRKHDEEETAKVYKDFIAEFSETPKISFSINVPQNIAKNTEALISSQSANSVSTAQKDKKKSNLESFKEELEKEHKQRELRENILKGNVPGIDSSTILSMVSIPLNEYSSDSADNDPSSTCVYVGNLPNNTTEQEIADIMLPYGPIGTIRIVRSQRHEEDKRDKCCAFVTFMCRLDAESAIKELREKEPSNMKLNFGWAKPSPFPAQPSFLSSNFIDSKSTSSSLPFSARPLHMETYNGNLIDTIVHVAFPTDWSLMQLIHRFCEFVIREGPMFEAMMMNREITNPLFRFLFDSYSPEHAYYRWRLFSLLQGDTQYRWSEKEFRMFTGGSLWIPPKMPTAYSELPKPISISIPTDPSSSVITSEEIQLSTDKKPSDKSVLTEKQRDSFKKLLRQITPERIKVAEVMVWSLDHSECAKEIVETLTESLCIPSTPITTKISRLYVLSDILFNSSVDKPNAGAFRRHIEKNLRPIFIHFNDILKQCDSKIYSEKFKKYVIGCISAWQGWLTYAPTFLTELQNIFLGISINKYSDEDDVDGIPLTNQELAKFEKPVLIPENSSLLPLDNETDEDIDGIPLEPDELELLLSIKKSTQT